MYKCPICRRNPTSHSFQKVCVKKGVTYFYTCPAKATKYNDVDGIVAHYDGMLLDLRSGPWIWIFDGTDFGLKHYLEIRVGIALAKLINDKFKNSLKKIIVTNANWHCRLVFKALQPILSTDLRAKIHFE